MMLGEFVKVLIKYSETDSMVIVTDHLQEQPSRGVLKKRCSENLLQIYTRIPMPKCHLQSNFTPNVMQCHSKIDDDVKESLLSDFTNENSIVKVLIATFASGMGIGYKGLDTVVYYGLSGTLDD